MLEPVHRGLEQWSAPSILSGPTEPMHPLRAPSPPAAWPLLQNPDLRETTKWHQRRSGLAPPHLTRTSQKVEAA